METKVCKVCGKELPLSEFKVTALSPNGVNTCNKCCVEKARLSRGKNKKGDENSALSNFSPRELIEELRVRGYKGKLYYTHEINV